MQIVLARLNPDIEVLDPGAPDLGRRPKVREVLRPVALMWLRDGTDADVSKARTYAATEGYRVFTYPPTEDDPLGCAKRDVQG